MGIQYKVLGQSNPAATTWTALLTVPSATQAVISTLTVCNFGSNPATFSAQLAIGGAAANNAQYVYNGVTLPSGETFAATFGMTLNATDVLNIWANNASVSFNIFGQEVS